MDKILEYMNSPAAITVFVSALVFLLNALYSRRPTWQKYQGTIINLIRSVEKELKDRKGFEKYDEVLVKLLAVFVEVEKRQPNAKEINELKEGVHIMHNEISPKP